MPDNIIQQSEPMLAESSPPRTTGLILAGGRASRLGGQDKALVTLSGHTLLTLVMQRLAPQVDELVINSNRDPVSYTPYGLPVLADRLPGQPGPLAGLHAGLLFRPEDQILLLAVDLPLIPADLVARLRSGLGERLCAYATDGRQHALAVLCRPGLAQRVRDFLVAGRRRVRDFLECYGNAVIFDRPQDRGLFLSLNTPEELARADASSLSYTHPSL